MGALPASECSCAWVSKLPKLSSCRRVLLSGRRRKVLHSRSMPPAPRRRLICANGTPARRLDSMQVARWRRLKGYDEWVFTHRQYGETKNQEALISGTMGETRMGKRDTEVS